MTSDIPVLSRGVETGTCLCGKLTVAVDGSRGIAAAEGANDFYERLFLRGGACVGGMSRGVESSYIGHAYAAAVLTETVGADR